MFSAFDCCLRITIIRTIINMITIVTFVFSLSLSFQGMGFRITFVWKFLHAGYKKAVGRLS